MVFSVTNNGLQERYQTFIGEGKPPVVSTIDTKIDETSKVLYTIFTLQPSGKKTQMALGGFQTVNMGNSTLESSDNTYVRTDVAGDKTLDMQGHMDITGSLHIKALVDLYSYQQTKFDGQNIYLPTALIHSGDTDTKMMI